MARSSAFRSSVPGALRPSTPIAGLAAIAAAGGVLLPTIYAAEAPAWAAQAFGQAGR